VGQDGRPFRIADSWLLILAAHPLKSTFVLALLVRLINIALLTHRDAFFAEQDAFGYWALGAALAKRETFWPTLLAMTDRMPLYPLLVAGIQHIFGDAPRAVALVQAVIDATTCALIAALGALISPPVALIGGILAALSVTLIVFSTQILTESLFLFFFTLMLFAGARFLLRPTAGLAVWAGVSGGLALATRPAIALLLGAAVPLVFVIALVQRRSVGLALAAAVLFAIAAAAPIAPVLLRNVVYHQSSSLTSQGGGPSCLVDCPAGDPARQRHALSSDRRPHGGPLPGTGRARFKRSNQSVPARDDEERTGARRDGSPAGRCLRPGVARRRDHKFGCAGSAC